MAIDKEDRWPVSEKASESGSEWRGYRLRVRGTFLDVSSDDGSLSPRASSDPGSVTCRTSMPNFDREEHREEHYVNELCDHMSQLWGGAGDNSHSTQQASAARPGGGGPQPLPHHPDEPQAGTSVVDGIPALPLSAMPEDGRLDGPELRCHIQYAAREVERNLQQRGRQAVLSAIQEIPEQVGDVLQRRAVDIVGDVSGEVAVVKDLVEGNCTAKEQSSVDSAVAKLDIIPVMIQDSFEAYFSRAERTVRAHVDDMMQDLETSGLAEEQVVKKMSNIPGEVQEIAQQAMQAAVTESRVQAQIQIDSALASLPNIQAQNLAGVAEGRIMPQVPIDSTSVVQAAKDAAVDTAEHVVAVVKKQDQVMREVANQVVAETLLRVKVESSAPPMTPESPFLIGDTNEGSIGHPELCARPCLYFAKGACSNGTSCKFCHLDHPRRPVHPDKKNRQLLKDMPFPLCISVLAPVVREKTEDLGLGREVTQIVDSFACSLAGEQLPESSEDDVLGSRRKKQLQEFLRSMTLRSVMALLMRAAPTVEQREAVERLTAILRTVSNRGRR
mmetsp:Transcript_54227/g.168184  ORF Transcript_54227/g.168184 Transcript_54227/m.168184 type:complete len:557 (-) Transcript_54227:266-1936(-)